MVKHLIAYNVYNLLVHPSKSCHFLIESIFNFVKIRERIGRQVQPVEDQGFNNSFFRMIINKCYTGTFKIGKFVGDNMTMDTTKNKKYHQMIEKACR